MLDKKTHPVSYGVTRILVKAVLMFTFILLVLLFDHDPFAVTALIVFGISSMLDGVLEGMGAK